MLKKFALLLGVLFSGCSLADIYPITPYIGFMEHYSHKRLPNKKNKHVRIETNVDQILFGFKLSDVLNVEAGYGFLKSKTDNFHIDAVLFTCPILERHRLMASLGEGMVIKRHHKQFPKERFSFRLGTGYEYFATNNVSIRGFVGYQRGNRVKVLSTNYAGIGILYTLGKGGNFQQGN